jgi:hypothetical protein
MNLQFEGHTLEIPDSLKIGGVFAGPDGREYELGVDGAVYPSVPATPEIRRIVSDFRHDIGLADWVLWSLPGQAIRVRFCPESISCLGQVRHARHYWHGVWITCTAQTSPESLAAGTAPCSICQLGLNVSYEWQVPILYLGWFEEGAWKSVSDARRFQPTRLPVNGELLVHQLGALFKSNPTVADWDAGREIILRRNADWSWNLECGPVLPIEPRFQRRIASGIRLPRYRVWDDLDELVKAIRNNIGKRLEPERLEELMAAMPDAVFVPQIVGTKHPYVKGYPAFTLQVMQDERHLRLLRKMNISMLNGTPSNNRCTLDVDLGEGVAQFKQLNRWSRECQFSTARRGGNFGFQLVGDYPHKVIHLLTPDKENKLVAWGEFRGAGLPPPSGLTGGGRPNMIKNLGVFPAIHFRDIKLPDGVELERLVVRVQRTQSPSKKYPSLDLSGLEKVHRVAKGIEARCPVCALEGKDKAGVHLIIYPSGAYGCVVGCDKREIRELVRKRVLRLRSKNKAAGS